MTELLPCPFCGAKAVAMSGYHNWIECEGCCAKSTIARNVDVAAERWNRRTPEAAPTGYPPGWPSCACGAPVMDGHLTCGQASCSESAARESRKNSRSDSGPRLKHLKDGGFIERG